MQEGKHGRLGEELRARTQQAGDQEQLEGQSLPLEVNFSKQDLGGMESLFGVSVFTPDLNCVQK